MLFRTKSKIDEELDLYKANRKLTIDEELSEWRRSQKNRAIDEVLANTEAWRVDTQKKFASFHAADKEHASLVSSREAEIKSLDDQKAAKVAQIDQVEADFKARGLLRDRAIEAEKAKEKAVMEEKDKHIVHLEASLKDLSEQHNGILSKLVDSLGTAASTENVTKVVGFGPSSEPKKV